MRFLFVWWHYLLDEPPKWNAPFSWDHKMMMFQVFQLDSSPKVNPKQMFRIPRMISNHVLWFDEFEPAIKRNQMSSIKAIGYKNLCCFREADWIRTPRIFWFCLEFCIMFESGWSNLKMLTDRNQSIRRSFSFGFTVSVYLSGTFIIYRYRIL